jgi:hypothetical protein
MHIWIYISGNLAADSMFLLFTHLSACYPAFSYKLVSDGYTPTLSPEQRARLITIDPFNAGGLFEEGDILLVGIMTPGKKERALIRQARERSCEVIAFINDLGGGAQKFYEEDELVLPDLIAVADVITHHNLLRSGIPASILLKVGSIYVDSIRPTIKSNAYAANGIGYLSVPNEYDAGVWKRRLGYSELDIAHDLVRLSEDHNYTVTIRKHPKENGSEKYDLLSCNSVDVEDHNASSIEDFIGRHAVLVSSYSTGLLVAAKLGKRVISYQPGAEHPVRSELYSMLGIPLVTDRKFLYDAVQQCSVPTACFEQVLYHPGRALDQIASFLQTRICHFA